MDADRSLSAALCPPSLGDHTDTDGEIFEEVLGEDRDRDLRLMKVRIFAFTGLYGGVVFDIVTVEGEGCSAAGWEEMMMSRGGNTERITDDVSGDEAEDRGLDGFARGILKIQCLLASGVF